MGGESVVVMGYNLTMAQTNPLGYDAQFECFYVNGDTGNDEDGDWDNDTGTGAHATFAQLNEVNPYVAHVAAEAGLQDCIFTTVYGDLIAIDTTGVLPNGRHVCARSKQVAVYTDKGWTR